MSGMLALVREVVARELAAQRTCLLGVVTATYPTDPANDAYNYEVDVRIKHEELDLSKVPVATAHIGSVAPPRVDDLVLVHFVNGDLNQPVVTARFYDAKHRPPLHKDDEILWEHRVSADETLNHIRLAADGSILLQRHLKAQGAEPPKVKASIEIDGKKGSIGIKLGGEKPASIEIDGEKGDVEIKTNGEKPARIHLGHDSGNIEIHAGDKISILLKNDADSAIEITTGGKPVMIECKTMTLTGDVTIEKGLTVKENVEFKKDMTVTGTGKIGQTTISGNTITGG